MFMLILLIFKVFSDVMDAILWSQTGYYYLLLLFVCSYVWLFRRRRSNFRW